MRISVRLPSVCHLAYTYYLNHAVFRRLCHFFILLLATLVVTLVFVGNIAKLLYQRHYIGDTTKEQFDAALFRYGVVIDCGSSGSRVFVYQWPPHSGISSELLHIEAYIDIDGQEALLKIEPGISTLAKTPTKVRDYLRPMLEFASKHVPKEKHHETPLYIMATAGMRLLSDMEQEAILDIIRLTVPADTDFLFSDQHAEVITGKQEGVYAWIAINYALGKFDHKQHVQQQVDIPGIVNLPDESDELKTVGMIDMGGGSTQIAFEIGKNEKVDRSLVAEFNLGCSDSDHDHSYAVYVTTFLGYGGNEARRRYQEQLLRNHTSLVSQHNTTVSDPASGAKDVLIENSSLYMRVEDPCLSPATDFTLPPGSISGTTLGVFLVGTGNLTLCHQLVVPLLNLTAPCAQPPCSVNGIHQPSIGAESPRSNMMFYGFSEFWYTMNDVLKMGGAYRYHEFVPAAQEYCQTSMSDAWTRYKAGEFPDADDNRMRLQCFKSAWMLAMFHEGLGFPRNSQYMSSVSLLNGRSVHWSLGALLYKTRFYPLSAIQQHSHSSYHTPSLLLQLSHSTYTLVLLLVIVLLAIYIYLRRLRIVPRHPDLKKVPSMAYFMTDDDQVEEGITIRNIL